MSDLKKIYSQMWAGSIDKYKNNICEIDPLINDKTDMRRGITILSYLDNSLGQQISHFLDVMKIIEPEQYYYPIKELHLTILSIISCTTAFKLSNINVDDYSSIFKQAVKNIGTFKINFKGLTVSPSCILIQGFPEGKQLNQLRDALRAGFRKANLESTIDLRYELVTAHTTAVRCQKPFKNSHDLMHLLSKYREHDFGTLEVNSLDLVFNNWYQNLSVTKKLSHSDL
tara:strand:+ start:2873 stop:3556 length:684 start_codon:yes stop_codon:yes gene_type:complete